MSIEELKELKLLLDNAYDLADAILDDGDNVGVRLNHLEDLSAYISDASRALVKYEATKA